MVIDVMAGYVLILYLHCNEGDVTAWIPFPNVLPVINTELGYMQAYYFACHSTRNRTCTAMRSVPVAF
jgi:hypothetical protein